MAEQRIGRQTPTQSVVIPYTETKGAEAVLLYNKKKRECHDWQLNDPPKLVHRSIKDDILYIESFSIEEEPGFEDVCGHGNEKQFEIRSKPMTAAAFADYIKESGEFHGQNLRFVSCSVGSGENSFAQQLSKILGIRVKAPNMDAYYDTKDGVIFIGSPHANVGKWRVFENGEEIL